MTEGSSIFAFFFSGSGEGFGDDILEAGLDEGDIMSEDNPSIMDSADELSKGVEEEAEDDLLLKESAMDRGWNVEAMGAEGGMGTPVAGSLTALLLTLDKCARSLWPQSASTPGLDIRN